MARLAFLTERMRLGFGVDLVVDQVASGLTRSGHEVTVYASYEDGTYRDRPYRLERLGVPATKYAPLYDASALRRARQVGLSSRAHDLFLIETPPFFALLPWLRTRAIAVDHGVIDPGGFPLPVRANFAATKALQNRVYFPFANSIITVSSFLRDQLPARLRRRAVTVHNGADHYPLAPPAAIQALRARLGIAVSEVMLLYLGRLNPAEQPYKGTAELVSLVAALTTQLPRLRLVMAGFGTEADAEWVRANGAVPFVNVPVADMPALLGAADLFVTASKWEGFNLNLVEAQRAGVPVVAFRVGAHPEVVNDGVSGLLVHSTRGFSDAVRELVVDEGRRKAMAKMAQEWSERFTWAQAVAGYDALITAALGLHRSPRRSRDRPDSRPRPPGARLASP